MTYQEILDLINLNLASRSRIPAVKHREVETALLDFTQSNVAQQYDIKAIHASPEYLGFNFDLNGLGRNLRTGWAICNGNNGTPNLKGRVLVHYSADFRLGTVGGSKDAVVVAHNHKLRTSLRDDGHYGNLVETANTEEYTDAHYTPRAETTTEGESGVGKNMPPYLSIVYIMKL